MINFPKIYACILCGGKGERLWPYSRLSKPKQLLSIDGKQTLLAKTVERCKFFADQVWLISAGVHDDDLNANVDYVLAEPQGKNTAAAILLGCLELNRKNPETIAVFLPADHYIEDEKRFAKYILRATSIFKERETVCLLGLKPKFAATGYGYIEVGKELAEGFEISRFCEKPDMKLAQKYIEQNNKYWNLGIFIAKPSVLIKEFQKYAPDIYEGCSKFLENKDSSFYKDIRSISIDYAVMEKSKNITMLPVDLVWSDIGNLDTFLKLRGVESNLIEVNSKNNLVDVKGKLVVMIGIDGVCIVEQDGILVIVKRDQVEGVREVVHVLKSGKMKDLC